MTFMAGGAKQQDTANNQLLPSLVELRELKMARMILCTALIVCATITGALSQTFICPTRDYEMDANMEFCYRYVQTPSNFFAANVTCTRERAAIVYIGSGGENAYIMSTYFTGRGGLEFWIGMNDLDREGTFKWTNLTAPTDYTNWVNDNPSTQNRVDLDCAKFTSTSRWQVHNGHCATASLPFLCKMPTCVQSTQFSEFCAGEEPVQGISTAVIASIVVVIIVLIVAIVIVVACVLVWKFNNDAFQRYLCCCVSGKSTSTVHSLQQENERLRKKLSEHRISVSGRFSHAGELSGVPDGRGGVLPTIKQVPGFSPTIPEDRPLSFSRGRPPPLSLQRPNSKVTPVTRGLTTPVSVVPTPMFVAGRQSAPGFIGRTPQHKPPPPRPIKEVKGQEDSDSSEDEFFKTEEGVPDPRAEKGVSDPRVEGGVPHPTTAKKQTDPQSQDNPRKVPLE